MGGMTVMPFAIAHPQEVLSLALFDTSAEEEKAENTPRYDALLAASRGPNVAAVAGAVAAIMFSAGFQTSHPEVVAAYKKSYAALDFDALEPALNAVTGRKNLLAALSRLRVPALVVVGQEDAATELDQAEHIAAAIPGARLEILAGAGHMSVIEQPERVTALLSTFLDGVTAGAAK
jgi:pimeloyl-ACP methyl ester carboxylesterase